jgi:hypothetical protein
MRIKTLVFFRSRSNPKRGMAAAALPILDPRTVWVPSTMTEAKIQSLVDRGLLRPKAEVEWKAAAGEEFPTEDVREQVVSRPSLSVASTSSPGISSEVSSSTTSWSWYISSPTPLL